MSLKISESLREGWEADTQDSSERKPAVGNPESVTSSLTRTNGIRGNESRRFVSLKRTPSLPCLVTCLLSFTDKNNEQISIPGLLTRCSEGERSQAVRRPDLSTGYIIKSSCDLDQLHLSKPWFPVASGEDGDLCLTNLKEADTGAVVGVMCMTEF